MKQTTFRANATEINKAPHKVRYVFIVVGNNNKVTSFLSYQTLDKVNEARTSVIKIADIWNNTILILKPGSLVKLKEEWRNNYFNFEWEIPKEYLV